MSWQKPWNLQSHLRPCFNCGVQYKRDSLRCPNCGAPKGLQQGQGDRFIKRSQERTPSKEMRSPRFQIPEESLRDRVVDIFQMAFDIIKNSLRESWLGQEILQRTNFATPPTETTAATPLIGAHIPLSEVGRVLGHSQANTTYCYVNANVDTAKRAAVALDAFNTETLETVNTPELVH